MVLREKHSASEFELASRVTKRLSGVPYEPFSAPRAGWGRGLAVRCSHHATALSVLVNRVVVITGGRGWQDDAGELDPDESCEQGREVPAVRPTDGRRRGWTETPGMEAKTIHRCWKLTRNGAIQQKRVEHARLRSSGSGRNLDGDVPLMHSLVRAVPNRAGLVLVAT